MAWLQLLFVTKTNVRSECDAAQRGIELKKSDTRPFLFVILEDAGLVQAQGEWDEYIRRKKELQEDERELRAKMIDEPMPRWT